MRESHALFYHKRHFTHAHTHTLTARNGKLWDTGVTSHTVQNRTDWLIHLTKSPHTIRRTNCFPPDATTMEIVVLLALGGFSFFLTIGPPTGAHTQLLLYPYLSLALFFTFAQRHYPLGTVLCVDRYDRVAKMHTTLPYYYCKPRYASLLTVPVPCSCVGLVTHS